MILQAGKNFRFGHQRFTNFFVLMPNPILITQKI